MENIELEIRKLEELLLEPSTRRDIGKINNLLDDTFIEIGSSGKIYNKEDELKYLPSEDECINFSLSNFSIKAISKDIVIAIYRAQKTDSKTGISDYSLRSSTWKKSNGQWKNVFHQGTNVA